MDEAKISHKDVIDNLYNYAIAEQSYSHACDRRRPDWSLNDVMNWVYGYSVNDTTPPGQILKEIRDHALEMTDKWREQDQDCH